MTIDFALLRDVSFALQVQDIRQRLIQFGTRSAAKADPVNWGGNKFGRKFQIKPDEIQQIRDTQATRSRAVDEKLAKAFRVHVSTIRKHRRRLDTIAADDRAAQQIAASCD